MIGLKAAHEALNSRETSAIVWINGGRNVADALNKFRPCQELMDVPRNYQIYDQAPQWMLREAYVAKKHASKSDIESDCDVPKTRGLYYLNIQLACSRDLASGYRRTYPINAYYYFRQAGTVKPETYR